jgi:hypothetical protein
MADATKRSNGGRAGGGGLAVRATVDTFDCPPTMGLCSRQERCQVVDGRKAVRVVWSRSRGVVAGVRSLRFVRCASHVRSHMYTQTNSRTHIHTHTHCALIRLARGALTNNDRRFSCALVVSCVAFCVVLVVVVQELLIEANEHLAGRDLVWVNLMLFAGILVVVVVNIFT